MPRPVPASGRPAPGPASGSPADPHPAGRAMSPYAARPWLASYPAGVPADFEFPVAPVTRLLDDAAASFPSTTALAFLGATLTYRELQDAVDRFAGALAGLGVGKGDRVAIVLPNCPQNVIALFATLRLGAVVVQHNPLYTQSELRHQLADSGASVVVCLDRVYRAVSAALPGTQVQHVVVASLSDYLPGRSRLGMRLPLTRARRTRSQFMAPVPKARNVQQFRALLRGARVPARQAALDPEHDLALLQYTGGTTGRSRGAMLTHANLVSNAYMNRIWDSEAVPGAEVVLGVLPLFHAYGLTTCLTSTVLLAGTLVLLPRFDLDEVFAALDTWRPTRFPGVPPIYKALSDSPQARRHDLSSLRVCVSGAMRLPEEVQERFEHVSGARLVEGYGLTETSPSTHCGPLSGAQRPGTIGVPLPGTRCRVVDPADPDVEVPVGEPGELAVSGPQVFRGYWGREDLAGLFTEDGYLLTGDLAVMDEDGWFRLVDRKKELIVSGGLNIYPSEVEEALLALEGVVDAAVVGLPDRYRGESVKAFVVLAAGPRSPRTRCELPAPVSWPRTRCRKPWSSATSCRAARSGRCCAGCSSSRSGARTAIRYGRPPAWSPRRWRGRVRYGAARPPSPRARRASPRRTRRCCRASSWTTPVRMSGARTPPGRVRGCWTAGPSAAYRPLLPDGPAGSRYGARRPPWRTGRATRPPGCRRTGPPPRRRRRRVPDVPLPSARRRSGHPRSGPPPGVLRQT